MSGPEDTGAHTATPWRVFESEAPYPGIEGVNGETVVVYGDWDEESGIRGFMPEKRVANAAFIVRAVNSHDALVAALRDAREFVQMNVEELLESCCLAGADGKPDRSTIDHLDKVAIDDAEGCLAKIDAALAGPVGQGEAK